MKRPRYIDRLPARGVVVIRRRSGSPAHVEFDLLVLVEGEGGLGLQHAVLMTIDVDAVYEDGVLKPERPFGLKDKVHVTIEA